MHTVGPNPLCYGAEGWIGLVGGKPGVKVVIQRAGQPEEELDPGTLPEGERSGPEYLITCLESGRPVEGMCSARVSRDAQEMLDAGLVSADTGGAVVLPMGQ